MMNLQNYKLSIKKLAIQILSINWTNKSKWNVNFLSDLAFFESEKEEGSGTGSESESESGGGGGGRDIILNFEFCEIFKKKCKIYKIFIIEYKRAEKNLGSKNPEVAKDLKILNQWNRKIDELMS